MSTEVINVAEKLQFWKPDRLKVIRQSEGAECGLVCLTMIADYYGYKTTLGEMRQHFHLSINGATLHDLMQFATKLNLSSRPLRIELDDLEKLQTPCILHWDLNHFVVLKSVNKNKVTIHDPGAGEVSLSMDEVSQHFTGVALELTPTHEFQTKKEKTRLKFSDFWSKITGLKSSLTLIFVLTLLIQIFTLASPYYMQLVIDDVILTSDTSLLLILAIGFFLVLLFEIATTALRGFSLLHFSNTMNLHLGANLFHHLIRLPMTFYEKRHIGDIISRFGSLQSIRQLLTQGVIEVVLDGLLAIVTLIMILFYSAKLTLVVILAVAVYTLIRLAMYYPFRKISEAEIVAKAEEQSNFMETVRGMQTVKLFGAEIKREGIWQNFYSNAINESIKLGHLQISYTAINRFLFGLENIIVIYLAAELVLEGGFSTGMLFAFMAYKLQFMTKMSNLVEKMIQFKMLGLHFERLADIALTSKEKLLPDSVKKHEVEGKIEIKDLSFRYSDATPLVVDNLSLSIKAGESVAITGPSGCGKSTLLKLMLGLTTPDSGQIYVDDVPLEQIGAQQYRQQIAAVMQNDELLSGSVADNIAFFDPNIDMERVYQCATDASIHDDISKMPMAYNSLIGDMGSSLSGGQKQRVLLARALYKKPKILFMDEATSHLDAKLEEDINNAISSLDITRVIIAHRKETVQSADREIRLHALSN